MDSSRREGVMVMGTFYRDHRHHFVLFTLLVHVVVLTVRVVPCVSVPFSLSIRAFEMVGFRRGAQDLGFNIIFRTYVFRIA